MLRALLPRCARVRVHGARQPARAAAGHAGLARRQLGRDGRGRARPARAPCARAQALAGPGGAVVATGSIYLVADLLVAAGRAEGVGAVNERGPERRCGMIALVAVVRGARRSSSSSPSATLSAGCSCSDRRRRGYPSPAAP